MFRRGGAETTEDDFAEMCIAAEPFNHRLHGDAGGAIGGKT